MYKCIYTYIYIYIPILQKPPQPNYASMRLQTFDASFMETSAFGTKVHPSRLPFPFPTMSHACFAPAYLSTPRVSKRIRKILLLPVFTLSISLPCFFHFLLFFHLLYPPPPQIHFTRIPPPRPYPPHLSPRAPASSSSPGTPFWPLPSERSWLSSLPSQVVAY